MKNKLPLASLAGVLTWLLVLIITLHILLRAPTPQPWWPVLVLFLVYGAAFSALTFDYFRCPPDTGKGKVLLMLQLGSAFSILILLPDASFGYLSILTIIWAAVLPYAISQRRALLVTAIVVVLWFSLTSYLQQQPQWISAMLYGTFHLFAVLVQSTAKAEQEAKQALAVKHQQLQATQQLLQAASRQSERTRIARNLHDVVGHHLTALSIQLQVAGHISDGEARVQIDKCQQLAKLLLSDVREAVSTMRQYADMSLFDAITQMTTLLPQQLALKLQIADDIMLYDLLQGQHLLCIVQEAISNSLKHSNATELAISASVDKGWLQIIMSDNGQLAERWRAGNGITGMRERAIECGGQLQAQRIDGAMQLSLQLPYQGTDNV